MPNYIETNNFLYKEGTIFGEANDIPFIDYFNLIRNQGIFFDGRILGIFVYIYFYILIQKKKNINLLEVCLLFAVSLSTVSRGGIIVFIFLLILFIYFRVNKNFKIGLIIISIITFIIIGFGNVSISLNNNLVDFTSTFDIFSNDNSKKNVLSQRQIFSDYALSAFEKKPILGEGVGNLTSKKADLNVEIDSGAGIVSYNVVTDAFIFSLLGEMGILGMILFLLAFSEIIIIKNNIFSYGMFVGVIIHLIGTDIPDIFMPYFVVLFLFSYVKLSNNNKLRYKSNY
ncbi:O-antigen ligase family protein [Apibacter raozihei]|uniref:O-antigen ligase family protein n=1 Tax=Apibacter raozihei TaxID=2500547 RepID=UPI0013E34994|nr:O-antigen ligase family protein [Apibacter raozihei]